MSAELLAEETWHSHTTLSSCKIWQCWGQGWHLKTEHQSRRRILTRALPDARVVQHLHHIIIRTSCRQR